MSRSHIYTIAVQMKRAAERAKTRPDSDRLAAMLGALEHVLQLASFIDSDRALADAAQRCGAAALHARVNGPESAAYVLGLLVDETKEQRS